MTLFHPFPIQVIRHIRKKYACTCCQAGVKTAPLPQQPIPQSIASPGLLAHIAVSKYQDALPLYRQEKILQRIGVDLPRAIRPFVTGRKNWLFSDTVRGAQASANLYSLIETAKANGHEPYHYLRYIFKALPATQSVEDIEALLPWSLVADDLTSPAVYVDERG